MSVSSAANTLCAFTLMVFAPVAGHLPAARKEHEIGGAVLLFDHVQAFLDLTAQRFGVEIPAQEDRLDGLSQFGEGAAEMAAVRIDARVNLHSPPTRIASRASRRLQSFLNPCESIIQRRSAAYDHGKLPSHRKAASSH